jgi:hypothetical protein
MWTHPLIGAGRADIGRLLAPVRRAEPKALAEQRSERTHVRERAAEAGNARIGRITGASQGGG